MLMVSFATQEPVVLRPTTVVEWGQEVVDQYKLGDLS